jgi:hypothetical protein
LIRKDLRERFQGELTAAEKAFFLRKAREAIYEKGYRAGEDLFHYCWFLTMKERLRTIRPDRRDGHLRMLLVEGAREVEDAVKLYAGRLESSRLPSPDRRGGRFIEDLGR